jgi:hypothetical protein
LGEPQSQRSRFPQTRFHPPHVTKAMQSLIKSPDGLLERWYIGPMTGQHYEWNGEKKQIYLLELATADLKIVCSQHAGRRKNPSSNRKSAELFVKEHLERNPDATLDSVREAAKSTFGREVVDRAYRRQREQNTGSAVKRGPRPKSPTPNSAEK